MRKMVLYAVEVLAAIALWWWLHEALGWPLFGVLAVACAIGLGAGLASGRGPGLVRRFRTWTRGRGQSKSRLMVQDHPALPEILGGDRDDGSLASIRAHRSTAFPSQKLIDLVGEGGFHYVGLINIYDVIAACGFLPHHWILEPGCGSGRNARLLAPLLDLEAGRYCGFDVDKEAIDWCRESISSPYPQARFEHADVQNTHYNPNGSIPPDSYRFPYDDACFDTVFLPSVFTHMTRAGMESYLSEIHRVTKPGGRVLLWFFLFDGETTGVKSSGWRQLDAVTRCCDIDSPDTTVAYESRHVYECLRRYGLTPELRMRGNWDGFPPTGIAGGQDRVLAIRRSSSRSLRRRILSEQIGGK